MIGMTIYGYCNGFFGRDDYNTKRIEAEGGDWIVARALDDGAIPTFAAFDNEEEKNKYLEDWKIERDF